MTLELTASMMCANYGNLEKEVKELDKGGIDSFHIDIMDGRFVPNYAMSLNDLKYIAGATKKPLDVHLMIEHPNNNVQLFLKNLRPNDTVYIHPEAEYHPSTTLQKIIDAGMVPGIAINPGTSVETVYEMLRIVKKVLVMTVKSWKCRTNVYALCREENNKTAAFKGGDGFKTYWDGACSADKILKFAPRGMNGFVLGTTILFGKNRPYKETLQEIRDYSSAW